MNHKISLLLQVLICMFLLSGCDSSSVSSNGNECYIINENHFTFEDYNVLEVIVSDSEKFVLYDTEIDDYESGIGEWIKDGVSYPIAFMDYDNNHLSGKHANIIIVPNANYGIYWNTKDTDEMPPVIAMINNDTTNPGLYRWSTGAYLYNCKFETKKEDVQYLTYTNNALSDHLYIPEKVAYFYSSNKEDITFASDELNIWFDGETGEGFWTLDNIDIPIIASLDQSQFILSVHYNTADEKQGMLIFSMSGTSVNDITENRATFMLNSFPQNLGYESNTMIVIEKNE